MSDQQPPPGERPREPRPPAPGPGGPPAGPPFPQPTGLSNKAKFWFGVLLAIPVLIVSGLVSSVPSIVLSNATGAVGTAAGIVTLVLDVALLVLLVAGIVWRPTRWWALGAVAGMAVLFVVLAGACVVLLVGLGAAERLSDSADPQVGWDTGRVVSESVKTLPLVFEAPRGRGKPPRHLADLTPAERKERLEELGCPASGREQLSTHYFSRLVDDPDQMTDLPVGPARRARRGPAAAPDDAAEDPGGRQGRHPQDAVEALRRSAGRVGADALPRPGHDLRLQPGRLRDGLPVLRHRPGRPAAQHVHRRDRRAGRRRRAGARSRRGGRRPRAASRTWCSWAWASRWPTTGP